MPVINLKEIRGYSIGHACVCCGCIEIDEKKELTFEDIIREGNEGCLYFCDRCGQQM